MATYNYKNMTVASDAGATDYFSWDVALSGNGLVLACGASFWDGAGGNQGQVYVFDLVGSVWVERSKVTASDAGGNDWFGAGVGLSEDGAVLAVAATGWDDSFSDQGGLYIYDWVAPNWVQRGSVIVTDSPEANIWLGNSCALNGDGSVVAWGTKNKDSGEGTVYVHDWSGSVWTQRSALKPDTPITFTDFGTSCSLSSSGSILAVGAPKEAWGGAGSANGVVYIFDWNGSAWIERGRAQPATLAHAEAYGQGCGLSGDGSKLIASGTGADETTYLLSWNGSAWVEDSTITEPIVVTGFGSACACSYDFSKLVIGSIEHTVTASNQGAVFYYELFTSFSGTITETLDIVDWVVDVFRLDTLALLDTIDVTTDYSVDISASGYEGACMLVCRPKTGDIWAVANTYSLDEYVLATDITATPHLWKCTTAGTSAATEPTWNLTGTTTDGTVTWTYVSELATPVALPPKIPNV